MNAEPAPAKRKLGWGHAQVALATGASLVALAWVSKRVLDREMRPLFLALPPLLLMAYESIAARTASPLWARARTWVLAILGTTAAIVLGHLVPGR